MTLALLVTRKKYINIYKLKKSIYIFISYLEKISKTTATENYPCWLGEFFHWFCQCCVVFLPLCIVFSPTTTATSCQDADFSPCMIYIYIYMFIYEKISISIEEDLKDLQMRTLFNEPFFKNIIIFTELES